MYKSQFPKIDSYDWFCGPGSQIAARDFVASRWILKKKNCFALPVPF